MPTLGSRLKRSTLAMLDSIRLRWCEISPRIEWEDMCFHILELYFAPNLWHQNKKNIRKWWANYQQGADHCKQSPHGFWHDGHCSDSSEYHFSKFNYESENIESWTPCWNEVSSQNRLRCCSSWFKFVASEKIQKDGGALCDLSLRSALCRVISSYSGRQDNLLI